MKQISSKDITASLQKIFWASSLTFLIIITLGIILFTAAVNGRISTLIFILYWVISHIIFFIMLYRALGSKINLINDRFHWFEQMLDSIPFPISVTDMDRNWTFINRPVEIMLGVKRDEVLGKSCKSWGAAICSTSECGISCLERDKPRTYFEQMGGDFQVDVTYIHNEQGEKVGHVEVVQDISKMVSYQRSQTELVDKINAMCMDFVSASDNIAKVSQSLAEGATDQASAVEELFALISETADQVSASTKDIHSATAQVEIVGSEVITANSKMQGMVSAMSEITDSSKQIERITQSIEDIASQTNLLSLNAAIEAARAGEAGRGFAVVADEIRELANQSAEAARNTRTLIGNSIDAVNNGTSMADQMEKALSSLGDRIEAVVTNMDSVAQTAAQQTESMGQINQGVEQISGVVQNNSAVAEESAATSEQLNQQTSILNEMLEDFNRQKKG